MLVWIALFARTVDCARRLTKRRSARRVSHRTRRSPPAISIVRRSFWTEDVTVRRALGQPLSGREAARKALEPPAAPAPHLIYQRLTKDVEVSAKWPLAFETGMWEGHQARRPARW